MSANDRIGSKAVIGECLLTAKSGHSRQCGNYADLKDYCLDCLRLARASAHRGRLAGQLQGFPGVNKLIAVDPQDGDTAVDVVADV